MSEEEEERRRSNSPIMPISGTRGVEEVGLFKYVEFDADKNEIRMEIPLSKLMDPEQNKALRDEID